MTWNKPITGHINISCVHGDPMYVLKKLPTNANLAIDPCVKNKSIHVLSFAVHLQFWKNNVGRGLFIKPRKNQSMFFVSVLLGILTP